MQMVSSAEIVHYLCAGMKGTKKAQMRTICPLVKVCAFVHLIPYARQLKQHYLFRRKYMIKFILGKATIKKYVCSMFSFSLTAALQL